MQELQFLSKKIIRTRNVNPTFKQKQTYKQTYIDLRPIKANPIIAQYREQNRIPQIGYSFTFEYKPRLIL